MPPGIGVLFSSSGISETIASVAPPLGLAEPPHFLETSIEIGNGDAFLLYTDGLFGGTKNKRPRLTPERLGEAFDSGALDAETTLAKILQMTAPSDESGQRPDDVAAVVVLRTR